MAAAKTTAKSASTSGAGQGSANSQAGDWPLWPRIAVTVAVLWHLAVVFISPFSVPPASNLVSSIAQSPWVRWYSDPLYLNHGYHFFGPDPPMFGTLIRYEVTDASGNKIADGEFPNTKEQWPRLWYHRHMMLADQAEGVGISLDLDQARQWGVTPNEDEEEAGRIYLNPEANGQLMLKSYARWLLRKHEGEAVRVEQVIHTSLSPDEVREEVSPNDAAYYRVKQTVTQRKSDLEEPLLPVSRSANQQANRRPLNTNELVSVEANR